MNPDDPRYSLAMAQFDGTDVRILEHLISDAEAELAIQQMALESFKLNANQLEKFLAAGPGSDALHIQDKDAVYILALLEKIRLLEERLAGLRMQKDQLGTLTPDKLQ